jgi:hypothetical protein
VEQGAARQRARSPDHDAVEYSLAISVNLYLTLPAADRGKTLFAGLGAAVGNGPLLVTLHALLGTLLVITDIAAVIRAHASAEPLITLPEESRNARKVGTTNRPAGRSTRAGCIGTDRNPRTGVHHVTLMTPFMNSWIRHSKW